MIAQQVVGRKRLSGLQKQVLSIYRRMLKVADTKDDPQLLKQYIRQQFKQQATAIPAHNHNQIEWHIRYAHSQLEIISSPHCRNISFMAVTTKREQETS